MFLLFHVLTAFVLLRICALPRWLSQVDKKGRCLVLSACDLVDGTPVLDVKVRLVTPPISPPTI